MLYTLPVLLAQGIVGDCVIVPGVAGAVCGVIVPVVCALLLPQALLAVTVMAPVCAVVPAVTVIELLPPEVTPAVPPLEVIAHPAGTAHV
jgi:hypothetical protein